MINHVHAEGFRSLDNFSIAVKSGLNVLVGPNGGGKTNILALFSFISSVAAEELGDAINASGGASKVFKKTGQASFSKELAIKVAGNLKYDRRYYLPSVYEKKLLDAGFIGLKYEWAFKIDSSLGYDEVFFSEQQLNISVVTSTLFYEDKDEWHVELKAKCRSPQDVYLEEVINDHDAARIIHQFDGAESYGQQYFVDMMEEQFNASLPLFFAGTRASIIRHIGRDLRSGSTFNFDPAICKSPNDSAQSPSLEKNGNGLAATIYAIQKAEAGMPRSPYFYSPRRQFSRATARSLQDYFKLINPGIGGVLAKNNPFDNKITVQIAVAGEKENVDFPLELASDGTVKWLAFTVALLTETSGFAIEEPENFLHPDIQRHAIELIRAETEDSENLHVLMTTHSETLLNAARPEELIIVSMDNGITTAKRLEEPDAINDEIIETGFGLGYYYISGALND